MNYDDMIQLSAKSIEPTMKIANFRNERWIYFEHKESQEIGVWKYEKREWKLINKSMIWMLLF